MVLPHRISEEPGGVITQEGASMYREIIIRKSTGTSTLRKKPVDRRIHPLHLLFPALACLLLAPLRTFAADSMTLDIAIQSIETAQPPTLVSDVVLFSYKPVDEVTRYVGARFENEDYAVLHPFTRNKSGIFVLDWVLPEKLASIRYRIVVDGLWMSDPSNPEKELDGLGNEISIFSIDKEPVRAIVNPKSGTDGTLTFVYIGTAGRQVSISGDFNNWDPFADPLKESEPGVYTIGIRVRPGSHYYCFFTNGTRIIDPLNPGVAKDPAGNTVSYFSVP
jgi:hypothetical protein